MDDFELLSAYVDGEVSDEERARIESDPRLMNEVNQICLLYTSPSPRDATLSRMPSSA